MHILNSRILFTSTFMLIMGANVASAQIAPRPEPVSPPVLRPRPPARRPLARYSPVEIQTYTCKRKDPATGAIDFGQATLLLDAESQVIGGSMTAVRSTLGGGLIAYVSELKTGECSVSNNPYCRGLNADGTALASLAFSPLDYVPTRFAFPSNGVTLTLNFNFQYDCSGEYHALK